MSERVELFMEWKVKVSWVFFLFHHLFDDFLGKAVYDTPEHRTIFNNLINLFHLKYAFSFSDILSSTQLLSLLLYLQVTSPLLVPPEKH